MYIHEGACLSHATLLATSRTRSAAGKPSLSVNYAQILLTSTTYFVCWKSYSSGCTGCTGCREQSAHWTEIFMRVKFTVTQRPRAVDATHTV
jgi:hypothetical protein